ncbi:MAG: GAF and ANTAR domain-containing protein [Actinobacteria bacterium]|nr:GAF and ANTAR domain-containing protein [Actinomycetota bacterium]
MTGSDRESRLAAAFVALADTLAPGRGILDTLQLLVENSTSLTAVVEAGIVLADADGTLHMAATTGKRVSDIELMQLATSSGPCFVAFTTGTNVEVDDIAASRDRWPEFADLAVAKGFRSMHAIPLRLRDQTLGSLNLFSESLGPLSDQDAVLAQAMADVATIGIVQDRMLTSHATINDQLLTALDSRVRIEQAKGLLAHRHDISVEEAFTLLRAHARRHRLKLNDVALDVVERRLDL